MINIKHIILTTKSGTRDRLSLYLDLPPSEYPWNEAPTADLFCSRGFGQEYAEVNFPTVTLEIIDLDKHV